MNLVLKLSPNENYFTQELVGILWTGFRLFLSNWNRFDLYFPLLKPKKPLFFYESKSQSKFGLEVSSQWKLLHWGPSRYLMNWIQVVYIKLKQIWPLFSIAKAKKELFFFNESKSQSKFGLEVSSQWKLLHWGPGRYLMNWIQVVYFKLKGIWPLLAPAKAKKTSSLFFTSLPPNLWMKSNLSANLALKLAPNDNSFTEELVGILWTEFKLFISNWKRFDLYFPLLKPKNRARFLLPVRQSKWKHESMKANLSANLTLNNLNSVHKIPNSSSVK